MRLALRQLRAHRLERTLGLALRRRAHVRELRQQAAHALLALAQLPGDLRLICRLPHLFRGALIARRLEHLRRARAALGEKLDARRHLLGAKAHALARRARAQHALGERVVAREQVRQRPLRRRASVDRRLQRVLEL